MAKTIIEDAQLSRYSLKTWLRVVIFGAAIGLAYWLLILLVGRFIVEPLACRDMVTAASCVAATPIAGRIVTVLIALLAIAAMVRAGVARPIIIAVASAAVLWSVSSYVQGLFWLESLGWTVLLYTACYALFGWVTRATNAVAAVLISLIVVLLIRIALAA